MKVTTAKVTTVGLDLAKSVFQVHGVDKQGKAVVRRQLRRGQVREYFAKLPPCLVGMEACGGAHYWGAGTDCIGPHGEADESAIRQAVCEEQQE